MKSLIILSTIVLVAFVAADEEWKPKGFDQHKESYQKCFEETGIRKEDVEYTMPRQESDKKKGQAFVLCFMKKIGLFTEEDGYNVDRVVAELTASHLEEAKARELVTKCVDNNEENSPPEARALRFVECMYHNKVDYLLMEAANAKRASTSNDSERR